MPLDLFGDPIHMQQMPSSTVSKQLQQRLDELRSRGCSQGIAWSKQGTIASIAKDGQSIDLRFLRCHPENGSWQLSQPTPWKLAPNFGGPPLPGCPIVHLAWGGQSSPELAIIDSIGRVAILSFPVTLNRPYPIRKWDQDSVDDLQAIVGCYWLPLASPSRQQYHVMYGPAVREGNAYKYETSIVPGFPPWHPNPGKSALLCVTASGTVKLFFQQNSNKHELVTVESENVNSSEDRITHASLSSDRSSLLMALATASKQLKVVRVQIQWSQQQPGDKQVPPHSQTLNPVLRLKHVAMTSWFEYGPTESRFDTSMAQLSHIEVLPQALKGSPTPNPSWAPAVVLTVRSYVSSDNTPYNPEQQSIVDRWELQDRAEKLHPMFAQLNSGSAPNLPTSTRLRKLEPIIIPKIIVSVHVLQLGKVICFGFSDGTVQYRDRYDMNEIYDAPSPEKVMSPTQVGFQFAEEKPCLQIAFSPTNCSLVQVCEDDSVLWNPMKFPADDVASLAQDSQYSPVIAALSIAMSFAALQTTNYDDILSLARPFAEKRERFTYDWIAELVRMLKVTVDYSEESHHDSLVRNNNLQMCLSILNHLGFRGQFKRRTFGGKFAVLALNIRNIVILITIASNTPVTLKTTLSPLDEHEVVEALAGCAKWCLDLLSWLTDCLFDLLDEPGFTAILNDQRKFADLTNYLQSKNNVALHLLLCSSTRGFLQAACRRLIHLDSLSLRAMNFYETKAAVHNASDPGGAASRAPNALYRAYQRMQRCTSSSLVKVADIDKLLTALGQEIRQAYQTSLPALSNPARQTPTAQGGQAGQQQQQQQNPANDAAKRAQVECELSMLLATSPPPSFQAVILNFFNKYVRAYKAQVDLAKLFFADYSNLEVFDDDKSLRMRRASGKYLDAFTRWDIDVYKRLGSHHRDEDVAFRHGIPPEEVTVDELDCQWRRCVRCAAVMEHVYGHRPGFTFVLGQQRKCACGGSWGLLHKGAMVC
ncbi:RNA polymerase II mediator complex subunit Sin4 [Coniochaeta sp. 2T2.1]|nr:RNA polymerase II mediator complex subunit Sin4 [Coniochaeta sp. 2T2.1]